MKRMKLARERIQWRKST